MTPQLAKTGQIPFDNLIFLIMYLLYSLSEGCNWGFFFCCCKGWIRNTISLKSHSFCRGPPALPQCLTLPC